MRQEARERRRNKDKQFKQQKVHTDSREIDEICPLLGNLTPPAFITGSMKQWRRKWYSVGGGGCPLIRKSHLWMCSLLQRGIGYRYDSKDNNRFICNLLLYKEYVVHKMAIRYLSEYTYEHNEGGQSYVTSYAYTAMSVCARFLRYVHYLAFFVWLLSNRQQEQLQMLVCN